MPSDPLLDLLRAILAQPTAPFHEDAVRAEILIQLAQIPRVHAEQDDFGNVLARYEGCSDHAEYAFAAHMDHPGYVYSSTDDADDTDGGEETKPRKSVPSSTSSPSVLSVPFVVKNKGREQLPSTTHNTENTEAPANRNDPASPLSPSVSSASSVDETDPRWQFLGGVPESYRAKRPPTRDFGAFAMWDLPACDLRDGLIHSRACDDLIGCVAIVALFQELARTGAKATVHGLFTRAEEVGFLGAIHLAKSGRLSRELTIVSLECSSQLSPGAGKMGAGPIIRVGDKTSIFDDTATAALLRAATAAKIPHQRCLMSGGTCEATAYQLYGYRCAALCVALGNYHNCAPDDLIAPEFVSLEDLRNLIALLHAASVNESPTDPHSALRTRLEGGFEKYQSYF